MADQDQQHLSSLKSFVLRARRIRAHSLAKDARLLVKLHNPQFKVLFTPATGAMKVVLELPPEEQVESAAARVRPLILNDEDTYHAKVMNALLHFGRKGNLPEEDIKVLRGWKKEWAKVNPKGKTLGFYEVRVQMPEEAEARISDNALAFSWIYGDVVHADAARREEGRIYGVEERFRAAVPVVVRLMTLAMVTLTITERLNARGVLPDLGGVFDEDVVVSDEAQEVETRVYVAEYDENGNIPAPPAMDEEFGEGWKPFAEVFGALAPGQEGSREEPEEASPSTSD
ncbi:hypothetical protein [Nesterenkonia ebinurensis]|uniref:hypothetical protein n=1 Tax=Nesterenkonia ebinurensis TaxID=2608252 RepID=UPI00123CFA3C|nr:hypothetical protein [Nesterenkonia ebinurensis]